MRDIIISRPFSGNNDLPLLKDFVTSAMANDMRHSYWHVGDLLWGIYKDAIFDPRQSIRRPVEPLPPTASAGSIR